MCVQAAGKREPSKHLGAFKKFQPRHASRSRSVQGKQRESGEKQRCTACGRINNFTFPRPTDILELDPLKTKQN